VDLELQKGTLEQVPGRIAAAITNEISGFGQFLVCFGYIVWVMENFDGTIG